MFGLFDVPAYEVLATTQLPSYCSMVLVTWSLATILTAVPCSAAEQYYYHALALCSRTFLDF